jgi:hypothetical protein
MYPYSERVSGVVLFYPQYIKENNCERCFSDPMIVRLKSTNQAIDFITKVESSIPSHMKVHSIKPYVEKYASH